MYEDTCTCGEKHCDPDSVAHFNRMREKDDMLNDNECGIFSDYQGEGENNDNLWKPM